MPDSEADATYERNVKEQYETLGRFVEAFELMVNAVRRVCIDLLPHDGNHDHLIEIVFHHQVMTAKPLFEIMRATIADLLKNVSHRAHGDRDFFNDLLSFVQKGYDDLVNKRNNLLHGTWIIGTRSGRDPDFHPRRCRANAPRSGSAAPKQSFLRCSSPLPALEYSTNKRFHWNSNYSEVVERSYVPLIRVMCEGCPGTRGARDENAERTVRTG
jgi:hypothetical protein